MKDILLDENFSLWALIHNTTDALMEARAKEIEKFGLTPIEHKVLLAIPIMKNATGEEVTVSDLSRWLFRKRSSVSELLTRMEKKGLLKKLPQTGNKNRKIVEITEKGKKLCEKGYMEGMSFAKKAMSSLTEDERHQLWVISGKLRRMAFKELGFSDRLPFPQFL